MIEMFEALVKDALFVYGNAFSILPCLNGRRFKMGQVGLGIWVGAGLATGRVVYVFGL